LAARTSPAALLIPLSRSLLRSFRKPYLPMRERPQFLYLLVAG
jgi:hypothetical protein